MLGRRKEEPEQAPASVAPSPAVPSSLRMAPTQMRTEPAPTVHKRLGELLIDERLVTPEQLAEAAQIQKEKGGFIGQILVRLGYVRQEAVASCLVKQCKIPHLSLLDYDISPDILRLIPEEVCRQYNLLPIDKLGRILTVAMVDPLDLDALEKIRAACPDLRIKPILCNWEHFEIVAAKVFKGRDGPSGGHTVTVQSLGFTTATASPKPVPPVPAAPVAEAVPVPDQKVSNVSAPAPFPASADLAAMVRDAQTSLARTVQESLAQAVNALPTAQQQTGPSAMEIAGLLKESLRETVSALASELRAATPPPSTMPSAEEMAHAIRDNVGGAMQEALAALVVHLRAEAAAQEKPAPLSPDQISAAIRDSVSGAMRETLGALNAQVQARNAEQAPLPALPQDLHGFSESIRDSVAGAMQEALAAMLVHMRAMTPKPEEGHGEPTAGMLAETVQSLRAVVEAGQRAQAAQGAQLTQIAEAALQSVQQASHLVEGTAVADANRLGRSRSRHASVAPFRKMPGQEESPEEYSESDREVLDALESEHPLETLTLDTFYPGASNAFTYKLSQAVAANPGAEYNPFFLFGTVGIGKTHLTSAIGNAILANHPKKRVGYVSASHFSRRLSDAMREGALDDFRENYCHWDVLILDDIQFMGGRVEAQEEFFHIFNVLHQQKRQIIIASDKAPDRLGLLEQRLVSRFASGIVAELKAPEWETRMQILRHHVDQTKVQVPEEILSLIAMRVPNDIRKMTGSLKKITAFAQLVGQDLSCEMADEILSHLGAVAAA